MPSKTAVPYRNEWVMIPTFASASGVHWPSNQHTVSPWGRPPGRGFDSAGVAAISVDMAASIRGDPGRSDTDEGRADGPVDALGTEVLRRVRQERDMACPLQRG